MSARRRLGLAARAPLALCALLALPAPHGVAGAIDSIGESRGLQWWLDASNLNGDGEPQPLGYLGTRSWIDLSNLPGPARDATAFGSSLPDVIRVDLDVVSTRAFAAVEFDPSVQDQQLRATGAAAMLASGYDHVTVFAVYQHISTSTGVADTVFDLNAGGSMGDLRLLIDSAGNATFEGGNQDFVQSVDDDAAWR